MAPRKPQRRGSVASKPAQTTGSDEDKPGFDGQPASPVDRALRGSTPVWLARSPVYRKVPLEQRAQLDWAILMPGEGRTSLEAIARQLQLAERYGIKPAMLKTYARRLEELMMPTVSSHVVAGVLSCMPESYQRKLEKGGHVLLLSRVLACLGSERSLSLADMGKLASVLMSLARKRPAAGQAKAGDSNTGRSHSNRPGGDGGAPPLKLAESVRLLYGLALPSAEDQPSCDKETEPRRRTGDRQSGAD